MDSKTIEQQAKKFTDDLKNTAWEYGFTSEDAWQVEMANEAEKSKIEQKYYPTASISVKQEDLLALFHQVKLNLSKQTGMEGANDEESIAKNSQKYLIAFNIKRQA